MWMLFQNVVIMNYENSIVKLLVPCKLFIYCTIKQSMCTLQYWSWLWLFYTHFQNWIIYTQIFLFQVFSKISDLFTDDEGASWLAVTIGLYIQGTYIWPDFVNLPYIAKPDFWGVWNKKNWKFWKHFSLISYFILGKMHLKQLNHHVIFLNILTQ